MKRSLVILSALFALVFSVTAAQADVITTWEYSVQGAITEWTDQGGRSGNVGGGTSSIQHGYTLNQGLTGISANLVDSAGTTLSYDYIGSSATPGSKTGYTSLRWGNSNGYSSIGIQGVSGTVTTDSNNHAEANGMYLWHNNNVIDGTVNALVSGKTLLTLSLGAVMGPEVVQALPTFATELAFNFIETPNSGAYQNDIFIVKDPFISSTQSFSFDGVIYTFSFAASFEALTGGYLALAQQALGVSSTTALYGWVTTESRFTLMPTSLTIHYNTTPPTPTPEPTTMVLLGVGLVGLGLMARRRKA